MDNRAVSSVVGFILVILIAITFIGLAQSVMLPEWNKGVEIEHSQELGYDFAKIGEAITLSSSTGKTTMVSLNPALSYPQRPFLISPAFASATISAIKQNISIKSDKINLEGNTYAILISPNYHYSPRPKFLYEHSATFRGYDSNPILNSEQSSFTSSSVSIYILNTTFTSFAVNQQLNLIFEPVSYGGKTLITSGWINFTVTNDTAEWWNETLTSIYGDNVSRNGNWINVSVSNIYLSVNYLIVQAPIAGRAEINTERRAVELVNLSNPPDEVYRGVTVPLGVRVVDGFYNPVPNTDVVISVNSNPVSTARTDENGEVWYYFNASTSGYFTIEFSIPNDGLNYSINVVPQSSGSGIFDVYWLQGDTYYWNATLEGVLKDFGVKVEYNGNPVSGARVDFSTDNPAILSILNAENVTDVYGETSVSVGCRDNGTANLFATSGGGGDVITLTIENCGAVCPLLGWKYRVPITITEQSGTTLTNFQVRIDLNSSSFNWSAVNSDASDIRFTADDGFTQLDYWIETWDYVNREATIWVKIPLLPANGQVTVYMYYGNPSATGIGWHTTSSGGWYAGNGDAVFDFFDDFEGGSLNTSKWVVNSVNYLVSSGMLRINSGAVRTNDLFNLNSNYILEGRVEYLGYGRAYSGTLTAVGPGSCGGYTCSSNLGADATVLYMRNYASGFVYTWIGSGAAAWYDVSISYIFYSLNNVWYILGEKLYSSGVTLTEDRIDIRSFSFTWSKNPTKVTLGAFHGVSTYNIQDTAYDWVLVRKLANPEPVAVVGNEEQC